MKIVKYIKEEHRKQLEVWFRQWDIPAFCLDLLSTTGLIIPNQACMFMYETNSPIIMFENLVSNRDLSISQRDKAIKYLVETGKIYAKTKGYKQIMFTTNNVSILERAKKDNCLISKDKYFTIFRAV